MKKLLCKNISIICAVCLVIGMVGGFANAEDEGEVDFIFEPQEYVPMYMNGIKMVDGYKVEDTTYLSVRSFFTAEGTQTEISWDEETATVTILDDDLRFTVSAGANYFTVNDRSFYLPYGALLIEGAICLPVRELARVYEAEVEWDEETESVNVSADRRMRLETAENTYDEDDLYWLARLINAESGNQSIEGKIAVGNVVLNRVADPTCPDTIYAVIFDNKYGVQFSVTQNGTIYNEPNEESLIAAKICLEGYNLAGDSIYFVNPQIGVTAWFANTRVFTATIGDHDFYA